MRILQLIDSLEAGGAERMAVNYANALAESLEFSGLVVSRKEGPLKEQVDAKVSYLFLNKKSTLELKAVLRLRKFVRQNKVAIVHAHGPSFFMAVLLKMTYPKIKIIWHEHYGARANQSRRDNSILFFSSVFFSSVFVVNHQLEDWVNTNLRTKKVACIPNFATFDAKTPKTTFLRGMDEKRMVCLANLKDPKNHMTLLVAFKELKLSEIGWTLHLIGKDYTDSYSSSLKEFIIGNKLEEAVFIYGSQNDIQHILSQATIGLLSSTDEGFPLTLLEYGVAQLPVVSTNAGFCPLIIENECTGLLFDPSNNWELQAQLQKIIFDQSLRNRFGLHLHKLVLENYSEEIVLPLLLEKYNTL